MSNGQAVKIYSIEAGLYGPVGFIIVTSDITNSSYPTAEWFASLRDWYCAKSIRVSSSQLESVGIIADQAFIEAEALLQAKCMLARHLDSLPADPANVHFAKSVSIVPGSLEALAQLWLRASPSGPALERVYQQSAVNAVRAQLGDILGLTPIRTRDL